LNEAFAAGWRAHAAAVAAFDAPPTPNATIASDTPSDSTVEGEPPTVCSPSSPESKTDIDLVLDLIKGRRSGRTSMEIIEAVQEVNPDVSAAAVRTYLHRLKLRRRIYSGAGRWFLVPEGNGNVGESPPTHRGNELENTKMPPP
jgi:hypothetical protein